MNNIRKSRELNISEEIQKGLNLTLIINLFKILYKENHITEKEYKDLVESANRKIKLCSNNE